LKKLSSNPAAFGRLNQNDLRISVVAKAGAAVVHILSSTFFVLGSLSSYFSMDIRPGIVMQGWSSQRHQELTRRHFGHLYYYEVIVAVLTLLLVLARPFKFISLYRALSFVPNKIAVFYRATVFILFSLIFGV